MLTFVLNGEAYPVRWGVLSAQAAVDGYGEKAAFSDILSKPEGVANLLAACIRQGIHTRNVTEGRSDTLIEPEYVAAVLSPARLADAAAAVRQAIYEDYEKNGSSAQKKAAQASLQRLKALRAEITKPSEQEKL